MCCFSMIKSCANEEYSLKLDNKFMQNAIARINELQEETRVKARAIEGAEEYIAQQVKHFKQDKAPNNKDEERSI